jgi:hypothetical protein
MGPPRLPAPRLRAPAEIGISKQKPSGLCARRWLRASDLNLQRERPQVSWPLLNDLVPKL